MVFVLERWEKKVPFNESLSVQSVQRNLKFDRPAAPRHAEQWLLGGGFTVRKQSI